MQNVLLVVHLIACIALVFAVMLQRSEGGALGMGGGGTGGLISGRGAASALVRVTMVLAAVFFTTSIVMTRLNAEQARAPTELERELLEQGNQFDLKGAAGTTTTPPATTAPPATTTPDPLAPSTTTTPPATAPAPAPSTATTPPAASTTTPAQPATPTTQPAPATPDPLAPAPNQ
jgi:preprotein translocase subunit SecG